MFKTEKTLKTRCGQDNHQHKPDELFVDEMEELVLHNHRLTVRNLTRFVEISERSVKILLSDHLGPEKRNLDLCQKNTRSS